MAQNIRWPAPGAKREQHETTEVEPQRHELLDETGISSALSWYVQGLVERSSLAVDLKVPDNFGRLPSEMELLIFRLVQECLTNVHRHSGSKTAQIRVERRESNVHVEVQDQGRGMSPERLAEIQSQGTGVGIRGMRERVRHFRGDLIIESNGSGTKVYATLPLKTPLSTQSNTQHDVALSVNDMTSGEIPHAAFTDLHEQRRAT